MRFQSIMAAAVMSVACLLAWAAPVRAGDDTKKPAAATTQPSNSEGRGWRLHGEGRMGRGDNDGSREGPGGGGPGGPGGPAMSGEQLDDAIAILREVQPELAAKLEKQRIENPLGVTTMIRQYLPKLIELGFVKKHDPEMYKLRVDDFKLDRATEGLARQIREAKDDAKAKELRTQLQAKVEEQFAIRQKIREREITWIEKRLADMKTRIEANKAAKDQVIKDRIDDLTGASTKPEW